MTLVNAFGAGQVSRGSSRVREKGTWVMGKTRGLWAVGMSLVIVAAACGSSSSNKSSATTAASANSTQSTQTTVSQTTSSAASQTNASSGASTTSNATAGNNGGNTDTGVTATDIKLGTISDDGLPTGQIVTIPVWTTVLGMMNAVNDQGGIYGRKVTLDNCDSAGDLTRFNTCFRKLVDQDRIFAFITSITWGTGSVHADLAHAKIPWFASWGFFNSEWRDPWMFPAHMASVHEAHGDAIYVRDVLKAKSVGIIYLNIPEDKQAELELHKVLDPAGIKVLAEQPVNQDDTQEDANVVAMRAANPDHVIEFAWSPPVVSWILAAQKQGYWPPLGMSGNHFAAEAFGSIVGTWPLKGLWTISSFKVWSDNSEYLATMAKYEPQMKTKIHHITQSAYAGSRIFIDTAKALGPNLTRTGMMNTWESKSWDAGPGMGVQFTWKSAAADRDAGNVDTTAHDTLRCEYMFKYNSTNTGSQKVWVPAPEQYNVCDTTQPVAGVPGGSPDQPFASD
jgi:ABC-type branched-subunit amino acid transport system substrate-binding protein